MIQIELATGHELDALSAVLKLPKRDGLETDDTYRARLRAHYLRHSATKADRELLELLVALKRAANACLIAAAPELLEALQMLEVNVADWIEQWGHDPADDARVKMARAAIAKATGSAA